MPLPYPNTPVNILPPVTPAGATDLSNWRDRLSAMADRHADLSEVETLIADVLTQALAPFAFRRRFLRGDDVQRAYGRGYNVTVGEVERIRQEQVRRFVGTAS